VRDEVDESARISRGRRALLAVLALALVAMVVTLPIGVEGIVQTVFGTPLGPSHALSAVPTADEYTDLHVELTGLDDVGRVLTLRVSGYHLCAARCGSGERVVFFALRPDEPTARGVPPSAIVPLPASPGAVFQTIHLPVRGQLAHYPFDTFVLLLGVALEQVGADGVARPLPADEAAGRVHLTLQEAVPQVELAAPAALDPRAYRAARSPYEYALVARVELGRLAALQVTAVALVLLVAATAAYAVFLRSLHDLVLGIGSVILSVWGIRSVLVPSAMSQRTGVDIALLVVIAFLLVALCVRGLVTVGRQSGLRFDRLLPWGRRFAQGSVERPPEPGSPPALDAPRTAGPSEASRS
jgi:hypothetical protein